MSRRRIVRFAMGVLVALVALALPSCRELLRCQGSACASPAQRAEARQRAFLAGPPEGAWDAANAARPCPNPFADVPPGMEVRWTERGLDLSALRRMPAVRLEGDFCGAAGRDFVNRDPALVLVIGSPFRTHRGIYSAGPVVAVDEASPWDVNGDGVVWFRDESFPRGLTRGNPILIEPGASDSQITLVDSKVHLGPFGPPASAREWWVLRRLREAPIEEVAQAVASSHGPRFTPTRTAALDDVLDAEYLARIERRHPGTAARRAVLLGLQDGASGWTDIVQPDPDLVLVVESDFSGGGAIFAAGPVIGGGELRAKLVATQRWYMPRGPGRPVRIAALEAP